LSLGFNPQSQSAIRNPQSAMSIVPVHRRTALCLLLTAAIGACDGRRAVPVKAATREVVAWRSIGSWSGRGNTQTESFTSDTGSLRVRWHTDHEVPPGDGTFRLTLHSAISGRPLAQAVDHRGVGADTSYVSEDPRVFFFVVDSDRVEWSFTIDEAVGTTTVDVSDR
jgi:hypothetical protein